MPRSITSRRSQLLLAALLGVAVLLGLVFVLVRPEGRAPDALPKPPIEQLSPNQVLIGTWVRTQSSDPAPAEYIEMLWEFRADRTFEIRVTDLANGGITTTSGTYALESLLLHLKAEFPKQKSWTLKLESIQHDKLVSLGSTNSKNTNYRTVYSRQATKSRVD